MNPRISGIVSNTVFALVLAAGAYAAYARYFPTVPCTEPIRYSIGQFDTRFGLSKEEFIATIETATAIWEKPLGLNLFEYDDNGPLRVNLIYDQRQATTDRNQKLESQVSGTKDSAAAVQKQYQDLKAQYASQKVGYDSAIAAYEQAQKSYEQEVSYYNRRGGAPKADYERLQQQKAALEVQAEALEVKRQELNATVDRINSLIDTYNLLVDHVNEVVHDINKTAGREFNEGLYVRDASGTHIDIYEYSSSLKLLRVLAHELGHALDLEHNENPKSIMYELNESSTKELSAEDLAAIKVRCKLAQ